ncbi:ASCH domain-containing protein [Ruegeria aquimaris]|uniref:ASCH domain-containing protein n=1 Tax=Ruegeria aquimaris TaxID=2984333 RepID=A0ABT3APQ4_9RHOB|nr:hypothetical protein [Ruegeria sp. XHP0148]MCV2890670.1 hypothetical protein [Ruegeria sp. XHP0148]
MIVKRGLIIDEPWIGHILEGRKDWEMRSQATSHRGWFGLIRKGSGLVVGLARLVDCGKALSPSEMIASQDHHRIPDSMIRSGAVSKWVVPWKLANIQPLEHPVSYEHKSGAVIWVLFSDEVSTRLAEALEATSTIACNTIATPSPTLDTSLVMKASGHPTTDASFRQQTPAAPAHPLPEAPRHLLGRSLITGGNLRNSHFYIGDFLDKFPADSIGGSSKEDAGSRDITVDWGGPSTVMTDIDRTKRMFRKRGWVRQFFLASGAREGDTVVVNASAPYHVHVHVERGSNS